MGGSGQHGDERALMYVIGLTGNIATGKSSVAAMLGRLGACVIDADKLAHWVMRAGTEAHRRVVDRFGSHVLRPDGEIDRGVLGRIVFSDQEALQALEQIVHPVVVAETLQRLRACERPVAVVEAVKLFEAQMHRYCDAVWVVTCSYEQQLERLVHKRHLSVDEARLRITAQPPVEAKLARAHVVIDNSGSLQETWAQVVQAWNRIPCAPKVPEDMPWIASDGSAQS